jgi:hypothetical protein
MPLKLINKSLMSDSDGEFQKAGGKVDVPQQN